MKHLIVILIEIFLPAIFAAAQPAWVAVAEKEGVTVYSKTVSDSRIKALKATYVMDATVAEVRSLLLDIPATVKWMCHTKSCVLLKRVSEEELFYYTEVSLPWPLDNRDFVTHLKFSHDPATGIVTVHSPAVPGEVSLKKGLVRISQSQSMWKIIPAGDNKVRLEYTLHVDPGGLVPAHLVNYFAKQVPIDTFARMHAEIRSRRAKQLADTRAANPR